MTTTDYENQPTNIEGITCTGPGAEATNAYAVTFTLFIDADNPDQASERAMRFRDAVDLGLERTIDDLDFSWHLHDHDGC